MSQCEVCGNEYDKTLEIHAAGVKHVFDSFECAIHALAPRCEHCGCVVIGHGVEADGRFFCCANCAHQEGVAQLVDRADAAGAPAG
jgi:Rieske Fe-S protein